MQTVKADEEEIENELFHPHLHINVNTCTLVKVNTAMAFLSKKAHTSILQS